MKHAFQAELLKIRTLPGLRVGAGAAVVALPLFSLLVVTTGGLGRGDTVTSGAATGVLVGLVGFGAWSAAAAAGEYAQHTISVSLATVPRRGVLYAAKVAAVAAVAGAGALAAAAASYLLVAAVSPPGHVRGDVLALASVLLAAVAVSAVGVAVGFLVRSTTAAIALVAALVLLPKTAGGLLGDLQPYLVGASPGTVVTQFVQGAQLGPDQTFPGGTAAATLAMLAFAAVVVALGATVFAHRDGG